MRSQKTEEHTKHPRFSPFFLNQKLSKDFPDVHSTLLTVTAGFHGVSSIGSCIRNKLETGKGSHCEEAESHQSVASAERFGGSNWEKSMGKRGKSQRFSCEKTPYKRGFECF